MKEIAGKLLSRLAKLEYDGLIIYDIQDESARIDTPRPFPFKETRDPREYSRLISDLSNRETITYKSVAQRDRADFDRWLDEAWNDFGLRNLVLVGSPSSEGDIRLTLPEAYAAINEHQYPF
ncbi:MAG: hypothetical protein GYB21_17215, partial [Oceanospirillales bacterium]|nr:hypothetical protein [Oceanospirillales bacterium]